MGVTVLLSLFASVLTAAITPRVFYVDSRFGCDDNPGTVERPFASLSKARDAVRSLPECDGVKVVLQGCFSGTTGSLLELGSADSSSSVSNPVVWCAGVDGAVFTGSIELSAADFKPVYGEARNRLRPEVRNQVLVCELGRYGIQSPKKLAAQFFSWSDMELVVDGRAMPIARYPNAGWLVFTNVIDRGVAPADSTKDEFFHGVSGGAFVFADDRAAQWRVNEGVYLFGYWCFDWFAETLRVAEIDSAQQLIRLEGVHRYGIGRQDGRAKIRPRRFFVYNLLEELDAPGEWYLDRNHNRLYFLPAETKSCDKVELSLNPRPLVVVKDASNIRFEGIRFCNTVGQGFDVENSCSIVLRGLDFEWIVKDAVHISKGTDCSVENCCISNIGARGLVVEGGDRRLLLSSNHRVTNNDIGYCGRLSRIGGECLSIGGCGILVSHNYLHDTPYVTMDYSGNEHRVEYNEIACSMMEAGDGGGMYTGRDWGSRGNVIRWNYFHHFGVAGTELRRREGLPCDCEPLPNCEQVEGLYLDDCDSGDEVYGNLFYRAGRAMFTGGGRDNHWRHNLVIDCPAAAYFDDRGIRRAKPGSGICNGWDLLSGIEQYGYTNEPWASRYPELIGIMNREPLLPIGTEYVSNIAIRCGRFFHASGSAREFLQLRAPNLENISIDAVRQEVELAEYPPTNALAITKLAVASDPELTASAIENPRMVQDTPQFRAKFPSFPRIPIEKIGRIAVGSN